MYVNSVYFITTTMTSVGYGDYNAFNSGSQILSQSIMIATMFSGILGFAIVKDQVFSAIKQPNINDIVKQTKDDVEDTLFQIDQLNQDELTEKMYEESILYMSTIVRFSIRKSFADNTFWNQLSP